MTRASKGFGLLAFSAVVFIGSVFAAFRGATPWMSAWNVAFGAIFLVWGAMDRVECRRELVPARPQRVPTGRPSDR